MTNHTAVVPIETDIQWRDWQARGVSSERRTMARLRIVMMVTVAALIAWSVARLS